MTRSLFPNSVRSLALGVGVASITIAAGCALDADVPALGSRAAAATFDWGSDCSAGSGEFTDSIPYRSTKTIGDIPVGKRNVTIVLDSDVDVDVQLVDKATGTEIIAWPNGLLNGAGRACTEYRGVEYCYSGYDGVDGKQGKEQIEVNGDTNIELVMKAYGYVAGNASVTYEWQPVPTCNETGTGSFSAYLPRNAVQLIGDVPVDKVNVRIALRAAQDLDIQLFDGDIALVRWPDGRLNGAGEQTLAYRDMTITWSGYNGDGTGLGHEFIRIDGRVTSTLTMKAFAYQAGTAEVTYEWGIGAGAACGGRTDPPNPPCGEALQCKDTVPGGMTFDAPGECHTATWCSSNDTAQDNCAGLIPGGTAVWSCEAFTCTQVIGAGGDLDVRLIRRLPALDYDLSAADPTRDGWPAVGSQVTWQAEVKNWGDAARAGVGYRFLVGDAVVATGTVDVAANGTATVDLLRAWSFDREALSFEIDPDDLVAEDEERNNRVVVFTDALSVGFYVEQSVYDYFHDHQRELGVGANSWDDWAQRQVTLWNEMFERAVYPDTPNGVLDRIRIDAIHVVADGALPLAGGLPTNHPNNADHSVDLQWGFPASLVQGEFYADHTSVHTSNAFYFEGSLPHELGHSRYLIDLYGLNVHDDGTGNTVAVREAGATIVGTPYMPFLSHDMLFNATPEGSFAHGLMSGFYTEVDPYSAIALNRIAGRRKHAADFLGVFINDLPNENELTLLGAAGEPLAGADVRVYRATGQSGVWYGKHFDDTADLELTADAHGRVLLGRCPFDTDGTIEHGYGLANGVVLLRVEYRGDVVYRFFGFGELNLEYWRGNTELGHYQMQLPLGAP